MFAYYADNHKGICMEFDVDHRHLLGQVMPVIYSEHLPNLDYSELRGTTELIESLLLTKAKCWQHESEQRVVRQNESPGLVNFPPEFLTRVIFGYRCTKEDIDLVKSWLVGWPTLIRFARAVPDDKSFTMKVEDFETLNPQAKV